MTLALGLNANNDLYVTPNGTLAIVTGIAAVAQTCLTATKAQMGEMVLNTTSGIPNFQDVWNGVPNLAQWQAALQNTLQNVPGVVKVVSVTTGASGSTLSYTAVIETIYGQTTISA